MYEKPKEIFKNVCGICGGGIFLLTACGADSTVTDSTENVEEIVNSTMETNELTTVELPTEETTMSEGGKDELQEELLANYAREKYIRECISVAYKDLMRYEDKYKGEKLYLVATVAQVLEGGFRCISESGDEYYVEDIREFDTTKILVDDLVIIWGDYAGITKLTRAINDVEEEVPQVNALYVDIYDESFTIEDYIADQGNQGIENNTDTAQLSSYETMYVVNCRESITLRTSPSTKATEICQIPLGAAVSYIEVAEDGFYKIAYLGNTGYALASYLSWQMPEDTSVYRTMYVVNCNESITLRTSPSTKAAEICQIPLGASVSYIEAAANGFYKIVYLGNTGYALASYLEFE